MPVCFNSIEVTTDADVDVTGHVHDMPRPRHQTRQPLSARYRALRINFLDCMDEEMTRARIIRIRSNYALEACERVGDTRLRLAILRPVVPRAEVHQRFAT